MWVKHLMQQSRRFSLNPLQVRGAGQSAFDNLISLFYLVLLKILHDKPR